MSRAEAVISRKVKDWNRFQADAVVNELLSFLDGMPEDFTGSVEIKVPAIEGRLGQFMFTTNKRQPKTDKTF